MHETWLSKKKKKQKDSASFSNVMIYLLVFWVKYINSFRAPFLAKKIYRKRLILLLHTLIILNNADARGWAQSEDACHVGGRDKCPYGISPAGPSWLPSMYYSTNPPPSFMNSPTDNDSPTNNGSSTDNSQEAHIHSVVEAVHARMLSYHDATK